MRDDDIEEIEILDLDEDVIYTKKEVVVEKKVLVNFQLVFRPCFSAYPYSKGQGTRPQAGTMYREGTWI